MEPAGRARGLVRKATAVTGKTLKVRLTKTAYKISAAVGDQGQLR